MTAGRRLMLGLAASALLPATPWAQPEEPPRAIRPPSVTLLDQDGRPHAFEPLMRERPVLVSFFFTGCFAICPPQTANLELLQEELARRPQQRDAARRPLLLSVSLDPLGDTPASLRDYARRFGLSLGLEAGWLLLTGQPSALARVWDAFEAPADRPESHAALFWLAEPGGRRWRRASAQGTTEGLADLLTRGAG